jgi:hypothetical protein
MHCNLHCGSIKNHSFWQKRWLQFSHSELSFICSYIPAPPACGIYITQLIQRSRACNSYHDVLDRGCPRTRKQQNEWCLVVKLKPFLRKFYGRHHDLVRPWPVGIDHGHVPSVVISIRSLSHSWLIIGLTWRVTWQHMCNRNCLSFRTSEFNPSFT